MKAMVRRVAITEGGRLAVGYRELTALLALCMLCSMLVGCGAPESSSAPTAQTSTEVPPATSTTEADPTERPSVAPSEAPTDAPTVAPTEPPTAAPPTTAPTVAATQVPAKFLALNPDADRDCNEFTSQAEAQAYWAFHRTAERPNPGRLDGNANGVTCEETDRAAAPPPPPAPAVSGCININSASLEQLMQLPEVKEDIANQILQMRPFSSWDDLVDRVRGIGENNVKQVQTAGCLQ